MKTTKARKIFKKQFGQANHFLITALIGIGGIRNGIITEKPTEFSTSWNPENIIRSADRTRDFVLDSFLSKAVDSLDVYVRLLDRKPGYFYKNKKEISEILTKDGSSIYNRIKGLGDMFEIDNVTLSLIYLLISRRNNITHSLTRNKISGDIIKVLKSNATDVADKYSGLLITDELIIKINNGKSLTFKETASLIHATHDFVKEFDKKIINQIDLSDLCTKVIKDKLENNVDFSRKYFNLSSDRKKTLVLNVLSEEIGIDKNEENNYIVDSLNIKKELD